jgi:hypothetical protein
LQQEPAAEQKGGAESQQEFRSQGQAHKVVHDKVPVSVHEARLTRHLR